MDMMINSGGVTGAYARLQGSYGAKKTTEQSPKSDSFAAAVKATEISAPEDRKYVTSYSKTGISCKEMTDVGGKISERALWSVEYADDENAEKVEDFLSGFSEDERLTFATQERFWRDFLKDDFDIDGFREFYASTDNGRIDIESKLDEGKSLREILTEPNADYLNNNNFIGHVWTEQEMWDNWYAKVEASRIEALANGSGIEPPTETVITSNSAATQTIGRTPTGIGSSGSYMYNIATGRLSAMDGQAEDEFIRYFNGDMDGADLDKLNGYDRRTKAAMRDAIDRIQEFYEAGLTDKPVSKDGSQDTMIGYDIDSAESVSVYVNGEKRVTMVAAMYYLPDEISSFSTIAPPFKTKVHKDYDPSDNSISIAVGDSFGYGNGYTFTVGEDKVMGAGYEGKSDAENKKAGEFLLAIDSLLHFADQQYFSSMIDKDMTPIALDFLRARGVDTSREFIVNGTRCEIRNGRIYEVGNKTGVPNSVYNKALARYEEALSAPLSQTGESAK